MGMEQERASSGYAEGCLSVSEAVTVDVSVRVGDCMRMAVLGNRFLSFLEFFSLGKYGKT